MMVKPAPYWKLLYIVLKSCLQLRLCAFIATAAGYLGVVAAKDVGVLTEESTSAGIIAVYSCIAIITFLSTTHYLYRILEPRKPTT